MEVGKFSQETGISIDTLRYYDKIGLLSPSRTKNRRCYSSEDLEMALMINKLKNLNFTLEEIKLLFDLDESIGESKKLDEEDIKKVQDCINVISEKYKDILKKEKELLQVKQTLEKMLGKGKNTYRDKTNF